MFVELLLGALTFLIVWDYLYRKKRNDMFKKYNIGGPQSIPILGNALRVIGINTENMIDKAKQNRSEFGKVHRMWILHQPNINIFDIKYIEAVYSSQQLIKKSIGYAFLEPWLGTGLLLSTGKKWHSRRKIITPTFHFKILEQFVEVFDQQSAVLVDKLYLKADGETAFDIFPIVCLTALDIIAETAMGVKVYAVYGQLKSRLKTIVTVRIMGDRLIKPLQRTEFLFRLTEPSKYRELSECIKVMHDFTVKVIEERRAALAKSIADGSYKAMDSIDSSVGSKQRMALLDVLLQSTVAGSPLSNEDIREEVDTFMFEGHDTTTSGISFCLYLIARHPKVQAKLVDEIHQVIGTDKNESVTYRQLQDLKYLECVLKESLRLYPSVPIIGRESTEDVVIGDITVPAKCNVNLWTYLVLRDPDYFTEPDTFKPERFDPECGDKINSFAYTPFSAGPRNCIGQKFAMLEMKSTISKVLRHFELLPLGPEVRPMINLVLRSKSGTHLGLRSRSISKNL